MSPGFVVPLTLLRNDVQEKEQANLKCAVSKRGQKEKIEAGMSQGDLFWGSHALV